MSNPLNIVELRVFAGTSVQAVVQELIPLFESTRESRVSIIYGPAASILKRIKDGEIADLIIINSTAMDELARMGRIANDSRRDLASNAIGMAALAGSAKPDISSVQSFMQALLAAKSIAFTELGAGGVYFAGLIDRLGIGEQVRSKAKTRPGGLIGELVANGEAELAIQQIPELMAVPGIELVGPLPKELQVISTMSASLLTGARHPEAAQAMIDFLATPVATNVFKAKGFEELVRA